MPASFVVLLQGPNQAPQPVEFAQPRIVIGREVGDIVLPDPLCSATHAEILFDGRSVRLRDTGSTNGTWIQGQRVQDVVLGPGVPVQIGAYRITLQEVRGPRPVKGHTVVASAEPPAGSQAQHPMTGQGSWHNVSATPALVGPTRATAEPVVATAIHPTAAGSAPAKQPLRLALMIGVPVILMGVLAGAGAIAVGLHPSSERVVDAGPTPKLTGPRETTVRFVWVRHGPEVKGGTSPARIRVGPNDTGHVSVGVSEEFAEGTGAQMRTATWLAAFNAARTVGGSLADYDFSVHTDGHADGPSAGMLTTAAMIALIRGEKPREDTTMTGTINPDGTAGPVGGVVQKMQGAKEAGLKRFGFPVGVRNHRDIQTKENVDLVTVAEKLGLETKEINDVYDGYEWLTGVALPRTQPVAESEMEPSPETQALLRAKIASWKARVAREVGALKQVMERTGGGSPGQNFAAAVRSEQRAEHYESDNYMVQALRNYAKATSEVALASRLRDLQAMMSNNDIRGLLEALQSARSVDQEINAYREQLVAKAQGKTLGGQISSVWAFESYVTSLVEVKIAGSWDRNVQALIGRVQRGDLKLNRDVVQELMVRMARATYHYERADVWLDVVKDTQDLIADEGQAKPLDAAALNRTVAGYASASSAVFPCFEALVVNEYAKELNKSADDVQAFFYNKEPEYQEGHSASEVAQDTPDTDKESNGERLLRLAAASRAYLVGSKLLNKWYGLQPQVDKETGNLQLSNRRALTAQLELAHRNALEAAARAKAQAGFIPTAARLAFQSGNSQREGNDDDKIDALGEYWTSTFWSEFAASSAK